MEDKQRAVLSPLIYSDIFSHPLTLEEVQRFSSEELSLQEIRKVLASLYPQVREQHGMYCLVGSEKTITKRRKQQKLLNEAYTSLSPLIQKLARIPTVSFIGLSGSLAAGSIRSHDDIDLFIICQKQTLFTTRLLLALVLTLLGKRRRRGMKIAPQSVCLNMFLDEEAMLFSKDQRDLYTAREIVQMVPLFTRGTTYTSFMKKNHWVKTYFPNFTLTTPRYAKTYSYTIFRRLLLFSGIEILLRLMQVYYMKRHRTNERIQNDLLAFHPLDHRHKTMQAFRKKWQLIEAKIEGVPAKVITLPADIDKEKNIFYTA